MDKRYSVLKYVNKEKFEVLKYMKLADALELAENLAIIDTQMEIDADIRFVVFDLYDNKVMKTFTN